ncbi:alpha/beta hydrolase [Yoonia sp. 208BN28-4]|uniref:alpha/beta hydrolase n=1 Tax=Yoonia sp. 208BN28-4 TaxID=3126505 RepID=UPI0030B15F92
MELDEAYANGKYIAGGDAYPDKWSAAAKAFRDSTNATLDVSYGPSDRQRFDLFQPDGKPRGVVIFVHGGYWLHFDKSSWSHLAAGPLAHGWAVAMPSYDLCPDVRISDITRQIAAAVQAIAATVAGPIRLTGHSAGGHLVARMLDPAIAGDWMHRVDKTVPISPLGDLAPLLRTSMNADLGLDEAEAQAESPIHQAIPQSSVTVVVGADERPAFIEQANGLAATWSEACHIEPERHHFDIVELLAEPDSSLTRILLG